jgi:hypothetical protein
MVAQSVAFSFTMGTNGSFACLLIAERVLSALLIAHFVVSTVLAASALRYLSRAIRRLSTENEDLVCHVYRAKVVVVVLFALIPVGVLFGYGTSIFAEHTCALHA